MKKKLLKTIISITILLTLTISSFAQKGNIRGFVYNKKNGEPVIYTNVVVKSAADGTVYGNATDENGYYSISKVPQGNYTLQVTSMGYADIKLNIAVKEGQIITKNLYLVEDSRVLDVIEVSAEQQDRISNVKVSVIKADRIDIMRVPTIGGDADIATYFQTLPGVVTTGDQGGQLYVRGGSPIQNKVLLDGMVIYNPFHSIGFTSVFDTDIIRAADIYTGGFGAEYGGRISSVIDITTRDGNKNHFSGKITVNPFGSKLLLEGPIKGKKNKNQGNVSYIFSGKTSYLEQTSKVLYSYIDTNGLPFNYTDLYGKLSVNGKSGSKFNVFGFNFSDQVKYKAVSDLNWNSYGVGTNFVLIPKGSPVLIEGKLAFSDYGISLREDTLRERSSRINGFNFGFDFKYFLGEDEVKYGIEAMGYKTDFHFFNENDRKIEQVINSTDIAGYVTFKKKLGPMIIEAGFRGHYYASQQTFSPEPRLAIKYNAFEKFRFKFASGLYSQNLISANSDRDVVNLFYGFLSGPDNLQDSLVLEDGSKRAVKNALQKATHLIFGVEYDLTKLIEVNVEGYYKFLGQITNLNRNKIYDDSPDNYDKPDVLKKDFIVENGRAWGVDVVTKYSGEHLYLWLAYSYSKVVRWDGFQEYAPIFDRRHSINFVSSYYWGVKHEWEVDARWNFGTGFPFTQTQGYYEIKDFSQAGIGTEYWHQNGDMGVVYASLNQGRLSSYHRLDVSAKRKFILGKEKNPEDTKENPREPSVIEINIGITNAYSRKNVFYFDRIKHERVNQLPFLPSIGFNWRF